MRRRRPLCVALAVLLPTVATVAAAQPIDVAGLQRLLQQAPTRVLRFDETRESPWLAAPTQSSGLISASQTLLEKIVEQPRRETWRILPDRLERVTPGSAEPARLLFSDAPAVAALADTLRLVMAGDLQALDKDFRLTPGGDQRLWTLQLTPRRPDIARFLAQLELQGAGPELRVIVILETRGERTTTRLSPAP